MDRNTILWRCTRENCIFSFLIGNLHPYDTGMILDKTGHCRANRHALRQPVMDHYGIEGTVRASLVFYNTTEEVDRLAKESGSCNRFIALAMTINEFRIKLLKNFQPMTTGWTGCLSD
jgi:hypothetical protein